MRPQHRAVAAQADQQVDPGQLVRLDLLDVAADPVDLTRDADDGRVVLAGPVEHGLDRLVGIPARVQDQADPLWRMHVPTVGET